jgi:hypothetical protein
MKKVRHTIVLNHDDWLAAPIDKQRDTISEMMMVDDYIGYIEDPDQNAMWFIFYSRKHIKRTVAAVRRIGFTTTGEITEPVIIDEETINKPKRQRPRIYKNNYHYR